MSDETLKKADKDYSTELDTALPELEALGANNLDAALDKLYAYEKKVRQASDLTSAKRVLVVIVKLLANPRFPNWDRLNDDIQVLVKKHGQSKQGIIAVVQETTDLLEKAPSMDVKLKTIETLRTVTDGRIYLELERARVTQILARIEVETHQNYARAADLMGELQVETFGSMEMTEKIDFILEQVELYLKKGDYSHAAIVSRKILVRYFKAADQDERVMQQKIRFYQLKVEIALHENSYLDVCQNMRHIYDTKTIQEDDGRKHELLGNMVFFAVLAPHDNLQSDILHHLAKESDLSLLPLFDQLVSMFTTSELIRWPKVVEIYGSELRGNWVFAASDAGIHRWSDLHQRIIEHNIYVIAKFYSRISLQGLTELLDLSPGETEEVLAKLVVNGSIWARVDRPKRIVSFVKPQDSEDVLNEWSNNTDKLLEHIETIGHLISKEEMMHGIKSSKVTTA